MAEKVQIDPDGVRRTTQAMGSEASRLDEALTQLKQILDQHHGCWGDDDIGQGFDKQYDEETVVGTQPGQGGDLVGRVKDMPNGITSYMESLVGVDADNAAAIDRENVDHLNAPPPPAPASTGDGQDQNGGPPPPGGAVQAGASAVSGSGKK